MEGHINHIQSQHQLQKDAFTSITKFVDAGRQDRFDEEELIVYENCELPFPSQHIR